MASIASPPVSSATFQTGARLIGSLQALVGLALAVTTATGLTRIAHRQVSTGLLILVAAVGLRWLSTSFSDEWAGRAALVIRDRWRRQLLGHLELPRGEGERSRGDLALAIEQASSQPGLQLMKSAAQTAIVGLAVVFWSAGWLSTSIVVVLLMAAIPLYQRAGRRSAALEDDYQRRRAVLENRQLEVLHHAPELRALGAVGYAANEIAAISDSEHAIAMKAIRVALGSSLVTEFLSGVSIGLVAMVVGFSLLGGRITLLHALIAVLVTSELFVSVRRYGTEFHRREKSASSLELLTRARPATTTLTAGDLLRTTNLVTEASSAPITLDALPSSRTLITGPSGSGKTTLLHTLLGWRPPHSGTVERAPSRVGFVSAESSLFAGSLLENLTLGADLDPVTVRRQLTDLGLSGPRFSNLSAPLMADGRGLSSGERVRLVLARCLLANPALLVLDDIGGVLDVPTRAVVTRCLAQLGPVTIIEATVDTPVLHDADVFVEIRS